MIELVIVRNENGQAVFSCANVSNEERVEFVLNACHVENEDLKKIENVSDDIDVDDRGSIQVRMSLGALKNFEFSKLTVSIENYEFNSKDTLKK